MVLTLSGIRKERSRYLWFTDFISQFIGPAEILPVCTVLYQAGFRAIEVPLNSPEPLTSIKLARDTLQDDTLVGAGTVLDPAQAEAVLKTGANLIVSPNVNADVIRLSVAGGAVSLPGVMTPSESLAALDAGASGLKMFPASILGSAGIAAIKAVLPSDTQIYAVGGVSHDDFADYIAAGIRGFGLGSSIYRPGDTPEMVKVKALAVMAAYHKSRQHGQAVTFEVPDGRM